MELINETLNARAEIEECIRRNGFAPEHNYGYYQWLEESGKKNIFLKFSDKSGILAQYKSKVSTWYFISMPIAQQKNRLKIFVEALEYIFNNKSAKKVMVELTEELRSQLILALKDSKLRIGRNNFIYFWPVFDMKNWDENLKGKNWKKIRNIRNRFYEEHDVVVRDSQEIHPDKLKKIVNGWLKKRSSIDRPLYHRYLNMINCNFDGADFTRSLIVDGEACSITAGWKIPNSNDYYSGIGLYNYNFEGIGEISNLDDLVFLKKQGFEKVDFGGSGKNLLEFKKKFLPSFIYKTYSFPIVRNV